MRGFANYSPRNPPRHRQARRRALGYPRRRLHIQPDSSPHSRQRLLGQRSTSRLLRSVTWAPTQVTRPAYKRSGADEYHRNLHPQAGHHGADHAGHPRVRASRISRSCGQRSAERRFSHHPRSAALPGASPDTMASSVATPLEKQFTTIAGLDSMTSTSSLGSTQITLQFDLARNIDSAALDVQSAISSAANQLPPNMPSPPTFRKVNPADSPILFLALTSHTLPLSMVDEFAETLLGQQISIVPGVAQVLCVRIDEVRRPRPGRSVAIGRPPHRHR